MGELERGPRRGLRMEESLHFWESIADSIPDIMLVVDGSGRIIYVNHVPQGNCPVAVLGRSVFDYVPEEMRLELRKSLQGIFLGAPSRVREQRGILGDGTERWFSTHTGPVTLYGEVVAAVIVARDITETKLEQIALAESEARFRTLADSMRRCRPVKTS